MNTLLGLHSKRVERVKPLSIFYVMHLLVVVLGGASVGFFSAMIAYDWLDDGVSVKVDPRTGRGDGPLAGIVQAATLASSSATIAYS